MRSPRLTYVLVALYAMLGTEAFSATCEGDYTWTETEFAEERSGGDARLASGEDQAPAALDEPQFEIPANRFAYQPEVPLLVIPKQELIPITLEKIDVAEIEFPQVHSDRFYPLAWPMDYKSMEDSSMNVVRTRKPIKILGVKLPHVELKKRMERNIKSYLLVPDNAWFAGVQVAFWDENLKDYDLFHTITNWDMGIKTLSVAPYVAFMVKDDLAVGASFKYKNNRFTIDNLDLEFGDDFSLDVKNAYIEEKLLSGSAFMRIYIGLGPDRRIGLFNDIMVLYGRGTGKLYSGRNDPPLDVHQTIDMWQVGMKPGMVAFITNNVSVEASIGLMGFQYRDVKLFEDGVKTGSRRASKAVFKSDILSLNLGVSVFLY